MMKLRSVYNTSKSFFEYYSDTIHKKGKSYKDLNMMCRVGNELIYVYLDDGTS